MNYLSSKIKFVPFPQLFIPPQGVLGGLSMIAFGLVAVSGARIWVKNQADFKDARIMLVAGIPSKMKKIHLP